MIPFQMSTRVYIFWSDCFRTHTSATPCDWDWAETRSYQRWTMFTIADSIGIKQISTDHLLVGEWFQLVTQLFCSTEWNLLPQGVGNVLHLYNSNQKHRKSEANLNFKSKIFGICSIGDATSQKLSPSVIVYGGREIALIEIHGEDDQLKIVHSFELTDWISTVHIYKCVGGESMRICLLTSHSLAIEFGINATGAIKVNRSACEDKCTLYSSLIKGTEWDGTTCFGGTALGELIVWTVGGNCLDRTVQHRLSGHNVSRAEPPRHKLIVSRSFLSGCDFFNRMRAKAESVDNYVWRSIDKNLEHRISGRRTEFRKLLLSTGQVAIRTHSQSFPQQSDRIRPWSVYHFDRRGFECVHLATKWPVAAQNSSAR